MDTSTAKTPSSARRRKVLASSVLAIFLLSACSGTSETAASTEEEIGVEDGVPTATDEEVLVEVPEEQEWASVQPVSLNQFKDAAREAGIIFKENSSFHPITETGFVAGDELFFNLTSTEGCSNDSEVTEIRFNDEEEVNEVHLTHAGNLDQDCEITSDEYEYFAISFADESIEVRPEAIIYFSASDDNDSDILTFKPIMLKEGNNSPLEYSGLTREDFNNEE